MRHSGVLLRLFVEGAGFNSGLRITKIYLNESTHVQGLHILAMSARWHVHAHTICHKQYKLHTVLLLKHLHTGMRNQASA